MFKSVLASIALAFSINASANPLVDVLVAQQHKYIQNAAPMGLNWKVGDTANYNINMSIIQGTMVMRVTSIGADGIWLEQNVDLGFAGKQEIKTLLDQTTGAVKKMIVNGEEQQPPEQNIEVISTEETQITVPAGTYDCFHVVAKDTKTNDQINVWINLRDIPLSGMLKQVQPSQIGEVTVELTSFVRN